MRLFLLCSSLCFCLFSSAQTTAEKVVYFDFGKNEPNASSQQEMAQFIKTLSTKKIRLVQVLGFTDKAGSYNFNQDLSNKRAENIHHTLSSVLPPETPFSVQNFGMDSLLTLEDEKQAMNRRVRIIVCFSSAKVQQEPMAATKIVVTPFTEDVELQHFTINLNDTVLIKGKEGTTIKIAPGSVKNYSGRLMKGSAELVLKEYYEPGDIVLAGLNTASDQGPLQTGGMFYMTIVQQKDTMQPQTLKPVEIRMPKRSKNDSTMNVFAMNYQNNGYSWGKTNDAFHQLNSYWEWVWTKKCEFWIHPDSIYQNFKIGQCDTINEDFTHFNGKVYRREWKHRFYGGSSNTQIKKLDSNTLNVQLHINYDRRGIKEFKVRDFDTSFQVKYHKAEYYGLTSNINWVNCDRFLNSPNNTELFVSTPNCNGATIMIYFKRLNAFMPAYWEGEGYQLKKIPTQEPITVIAFGKTGNSYYFGKKDYTVVDKGSVSINVENLSADDFHKQMKQL